MTPLSKAVNGTEIVLKEYELHMGMYNIRNVNKLRSIVKKTILNGCTVHAVFFKCLKKKKIFGFLLMTRLEFSDLFGGSFI